MKRLQRALPYIQCALLVIITVELFYILAAINEIESDVSGIWYAMP